MYAKVLESMILEERNLRGYIYCREDEHTLQSMLDELNQYGHDNHYLVELLYDRVGDDEMMIIEKYIRQFHAEGTRGYLVSLLDINKRDNVTLISELFSHFQQSDSYIAKPEQPAPAHIYVRYDNALFKIRSRKRKTDLRSLIQTVRDVCYLPLTGRKLASWGAFPLNDLLRWYEQARTLRPEDIGIDGEHTYYPPLSCFQKETQLHMLTWMRYYHYADVKDILLEATKSTDPDIEEASTKSLSILQEKEQR